MPTLDKRLTALESKHSGADLSGMTADELDAHLATLEPGSPQAIAVLVTAISRRGSRLPISTAQQQKQPTS
jgi:hypothetical protein